MDTRRSVAKKILQERDFYSPQEFVSQVYSVIGDQRLISKTVPLGEQVSIAFALLLGILRQTQEEARVLPPEVPAEEIPTEKVPTEEVPAPPPEEAVHGGKRAGVETSIPNYYSILGVKENATKDEIKKAYRELMKKYHPDVLAREGLSKEQEAEITRKAQDINEAYIILSREKNKKNYDELRKSQPPEAAAGKLGIQITPTKGAGFRSLSAKALTANFRNTVSLGIEGVNAKNPEQATGVLFYSNGVKSENLIEKVNSSEILTAAERDSFLRSAEITKALEELYPRRTTLLYTAWQEPEIEIREFIPQPPSQVQQIAFQRTSAGPVLSSENFSLGPIGNSVKQFAGDFANKQVNKVVDKATKKVAEKVAAKVGEKVAAKAAETGAKAAAGTALKGGAEAIAVALGLPAGGIGAIIIWAIIELAKLLLKLLKKIFGKVIQWLKENKEVLLAALIGAGLLFGRPVLVGMGVVGLALGGAMAIRTAIAATAAAIYFFFATLVFRSIIVPIIVGFITMLLLVVFALFIINSGAYIVPPGGFGGNFPVGGMVEPCPAGGVDITQELASRMTSGVVNLLPDGNGARSEHYCITPTMVILHSSGGLDNDDGNDATYGTLVSRNLACQLASDTNDTYLMQPFYETQVEMAWCANQWNAYGISIENAGEYGGDTSGSACGPRDTLVFANPPPHPCDPETDLSHSAVCEVMKQYNIPWCQVYQHEDVPGSGKIDPIGDDWVRAFVQWLRNNCHTSNDSQC